MGLSNQISAFGKIQLHSCFHLDTTGFYIKMNLDISGPNAAKQKQNTNFEKFKLIVKIIHFSIIKKLKLKVYFG
jgi:hypothetical protein